MKKVFINIFLVFFCLTTYATHNRAGEITYRQVSAFTFEFTITTFTNTKPTSDGISPADRPSLIIQWGDGTASEVFRTEIIDLPDFYRKNIYGNIIHTYAGPSTFEILVEDPNRNEGVDNIPNSVQTVFSIKTILQINPTLGFNNTPILYNPPVDKAAIGQVFIHNPAAYDPDGDSLSYELTVCTGENGEPIESYQFPASSNEPIYIDPVVGNLIWNTPIKEGIFNVAFHIYEWREGIKIGRITRDMQIEVYESENTPPELDLIEPICIEAGDSVTIEVTASDSINEEITLSATGGVFQLENPALFPPISGLGSVTGIFKWYTDCSNIREQPYQVVFKATDNNSEVNLVDQTTAEITVVGPAPKNLSLLPTSSSMELNWDSYLCSNHLGFNIYRSTTPYNFIPDVCETGVPAYTGFELIQYIDNPDTTKYLDNNNELGLPQGFQYCYLITAVFEENVESKASNEACGELVRGIPIITNVSITNHDETNGEIYLAWSKPLEFDTDSFPGPLMYIIQRAKGVWGTEYTNIDTLLNFDEDTIYYDQNINTIVDGYSYKVAIYNNNGATAPPMTASSMFPKLDESNKRIDITIQKNTPWINSGYSVFRKNPGSNDYNLIGTTTTINFADTFNLKNKDEYCYRITSTGAYNLSGIITPIINYSHQNCGVPIDTIPPLPPILNLESNCETFTNQLSWQIRDNNDEIKLYRIYFGTTVNSNLSLIDSVIHKDTLSYIHLATQSPSGCYAVTAVDSSYNESNFSNLACVDNCSYYELPNVFTPNSDNKNDLFIPLTPVEVIDKFIDKIDLKIYTRWGNLVYETNNPRIEWDGKSKQSNKLLNPGVYYYVCDVYEKRISGIEHRTLVGFVHIYHGSTGSNPE